MGIIEVCIRADGYVVMYCPIIEGGKGHSTKGDGKEKTFHMILQLVRGRSRGPTGHMAVLQVDLGRPSCWDAMLQNSSGDSKERRKEKDLARRDDSLVFISLYFSFTMCLCLEGTYHLLG